VTLVRRVAGVLVLALIVAAVAPFVVYAHPGLIGGTESYVVLSDSMSPAIKTNDVVVVQSVPPEDLRVGDVITYTRPDLTVPVTHRVVRVVSLEGEGFFETKGDANEDPDTPYVAGGRVVGKVTLTIPYIGYVIRFVGTPAGFATLVVAPIVLLIVTEFVSLARRSARSGDDPAESAGDASTDEPDAEGTGSDDSDGAAPDVTGETPAVAVSGDPDRDAPPPEAVVDGTRGRDATVAPDADDGEQYVINRTDLSLTLSTLAVFVLFSGGMAVRTGFAEPAVVSLIALGVLSFMAGLTESTRLNPVPPARSPEEPTGDAAGYPLLDLDPAAFDLLFPRDSHGLETDGGEEQ
jgi:signal peptidase